MKQNKGDLIPIINTRIIEWLEHLRFRGIFLQPLLTSEENPFASVHAVRVPPGETINRHNHPAQVETIYVISGECPLTVGDREVPFGAGEIVAIPRGLEHGLCNNSSQTVKLLTFFTPPTA